MNSALPKVLVADDEPASLALFKIALKDKFELKMVENGEDAWVGVQEFLPAVVLLDVNMPGLDGYGVCRRIKENASTKKIIVIFVSARDSVDERVQGYAAGGDDYVTKPFVATELLAKVERAVAVTQSITQLAQDADMARGVASEVMANMGELGVVLTFMRNMFACRGYEDVARQLVIALRSYRLPSVIKVTGTMGFFEIGTSGIIKPLESELINKLRDAGRIYDHKEMTIFNYGHVSILIKNMPLDNKEFYGRIKDHGAILAEGGDARVSTIDLDETIKMQRVALEGVIVGTQNAIGNTNQLYRTLKLKNTRIMQDLLGSVEDLYMKLGLSELQEERLSRVVSEAADRAEALYSEDKAISEQLLDIQARLQQVLAVGR